MGIDRKSSKSMSDGRAMMAVECLVLGRKIVCLVVEGGIMLLLLLVEGSELSMDGLSSGGEGLEAVEMGAADEK